MLKSDIAAKLDHFRGLEAGKYGRVRGEIGNYLVDYDSELGGTQVLRKGSWRTNPRLWRPRTFVAYRSRQYPAWVPNYVREAVAAIEKAAKPPQRR